MPSSSTGSDSAVLCLCSSYLNSIYLGMKSTQAGTSEMLACGLLQSVHTDGYKEPWCSPRWLGTQTGLEFGPILPQLSKCWDFSCVSPHLVKSTLTGTVEVSQIPLADSLLKEIQRRITLSVCSFYVEGGVTHQVDHVHCGTHAAQVHTLEAGREAVCSSYTTKSEVMRSDLAKLLHWRKARVSPSFPIPVLFCPQPLCVP